MKIRMAVSALAVLATASLAGAETWKNVSLVDTMCVSKVKADPDKHPTACALKCSESGYGVLTGDGTFLKLDAAGNKKAWAALKSTKKTDSLRATVNGDRDGETIKVQTISLD